MQITRREFLMTSGLAAVSASLPGLVSAAPAVKGPATPGDWNWVRSQFRLSPKYLHFASFYLVSHPQPVHEAIESWRDALDDDPLQVIEHNMFTGPDNNVQRRACQAAAEYINGSAADIALVPNTTTGLAHVYQGLDLAPGDEILATTHDHYVHHESIRLAAERAGASTRRIPLYDENAEITRAGILQRVRDGIRPKTRVLGITWVHSSTGTRLPVKDIAKVIAEVNREREPGKRVLLVVDGVHGFGAVDENVADMGADFFVAGTHKWVFAPRGTGIIYAPAKNWAHLKPVVPTFSEFESFMAWAKNRVPATPAPARRFTPGGFIAYEHQWAMPAAFRFHADIGRARIANRIAELNTRIKQGLADMPHVQLATPLDPDLSAGIVSFRINGMETPDAVARLHQRNVLASTSPYANPHVRLAAGIMNNEEEVDTALAEVAKLG